MIFTLLFSEETLYIFLTMNIQVFSLWEVFNFKVCEDFLFFFFFFTSLKTEQCVLE